MAPEDSNAILSELRRNVVLDQVAGEMERRSECPACGARKVRKGLDHASSQDNGVIR